MPTGFEMVVISALDIDFTTDNLLVKGWERYSSGFTDVRAIYGNELYVPAAPAIIIPSVPAVLAIGAAAAIIKNPVVERRAFVGWMRGLFGEA